ncbi:MAG: bacteriorhodopsin-like [Planctomycetota bacterium]
MDLVISQGQYDLVFNLLSLTTATMLAAGLFFVLSRDQVSTKYRPALVVSSLVVFIAGYHYFRIFHSWEGSFSPNGEGGMVSNGTFNEAYRYADWLITVPLLLVELVVVLGLSRSESSSMLKKLVAASVLMIAAGYPGEIADPETASGTIWLWWVVAMVPYVYILAVLFGQLNTKIANESGDVKSLIGLARTVLLVTWAFYPIAYLFPVFGLGASGEVGLQVGYTIADITAKAGYGLVIYNIAVAKSRREEEPSVERAAA